MVEEYFCVGKVKDAHGIRGEIFVHLFSRQADWLDDLSGLILSPTKESSDFQTYGIERMRPHKTGLIIKPKEFLDRNRAEEYKGYFMHIPVAILKSKPGEDIYLHEVLNFEVVDQNSENIGKIIDFQHNGAQDLIVVQGIERKFEIPFVKEFIVEIDEANKLVHMTLPQGILEI